MSLIRYHDAASSARFLPHVRHAFPQTPETADLVAVDWMGRQYLQSGDDMFLADIGFGEFAELVTRAEWDAIAHDQPYEAFDGERYDRFAATGALPDGLADTDCVEFTTPLFLGGADDISNMAVVDLDVHWTLGSQIYAQVRDLPPGSPISGVQIS
jgi:hypothetical protein